MMMTFREGLHHILPMSIVTPNYGEKNLSAARSAGKRSSLLSRVYFTKSYFPQN